MSDPTKYNRLGREMTGFESGIENLLFGHFTNPEYQALQNIEPEASCKVCGDTGSIQSEYGVAMCVDCCIGIPFDDAVVIVKNYPECDDFVCAHYEFYSNGGGDNSQDLAKYWQRCKEIVENADKTPW